MAKQINFFDGAQSSTTPTVGNVDASNLVNYPDDASYEAANLGSPAEGNIYFNTTSNVVRLYNGTEWTNVLDEKNVATVENKTIDGSDATGNNTILTEAYESHYDPTGTGLISVNVQAAITELDGRLDTAETVNNSQGVDILNLETLSGSPGAVDHGTFTGTTIPDNSTTKVALQALETEVELKLDSSEKGAPNGVAELDGTGKVPAAQLPSYVDDVLEYADLASFPVSGETGKIYVALDTNFTYRWTGSIYVQISAAGGIDWSDPVTASIIPDTDLTYNVGDASAHFVDVYTSAVRNASGNGVTISADGGPSADIFLSSESERVTLTSYNGTQAPKIKFENEDGSAAVHVGALDLLASDYNFILPPNAGATNQFLKTDGSGNTSWDFPSGGGSQGLIQDDDSNLENSIGAWVSYADAAGLSPVDGAGGAPGISLTRTSVPGDILEGGYSLKIEKGAVNRQGEGASLTIAVDKGYRGKACKLSFLYDASSGFNYGNPNDFVANPSDILVYAYDVTNGVLLNSTVPGVHGDKLYESLVQIPATCQSLRVILHIATTSAVAYDFFADRFELDVAKNETVNNQSDWLSYTPVFVNAGTVTNIAIRYRQNGPDIEIAGRFQIGTPTGAITMSLPTGKTIDNTLNSSNYVRYGNGSVLTNGAFTVAVIARGTDSVLNFSLPFTSSNGLTPYSAWGTNEIISIHVKVPITGQTSGNLHPAQTGLNSPAVFVGTQTSEAVTANTTNLTLSSVKDTTGSWATNIYTVRSPGDYQVLGGYVTSGGTTVMVYKNGAFFAWGGNAASATSKATASVLLSNLVYGDTISIRFDSSVTITSAQFSINKISSSTQPYAPRIAYLKDVKASGNAGGTFTSGSYQTRTLNTLEGDASFVGLAANQFTLQAGTYHIEVSAPAGFVNGHKAKLRNITDSSDTLMGSTEYDSTVDNYTQTRSRVDGTFSITTTKTFEIQHRCETTKATDGFGASQTFGDNNVFTVVKLTKVL
jgi:hypothetical protein